MFQVTDPLVIIINCKYFLTYQQKYYFNSGFQEIESAQKKPKFVVDDSDDEQEYNDLDNALTAKRSSRTAGNNVLY